MTVCPLVAAGFLKSVMAVLFVVCAVVLILLVLVQKGRGGGLSGALGGGMASGILGSKTGDFLTWLTVGVVAVFLLLAILMAKFYRPSIRELGAPAAPATTMPAGPVGQTTVAPPPVQSLPEAEEAVPEAQIDSEAAVPQTQADVNSAGG